MKSINEVKQFIIELLKLFPNKKTDVYHLGKAYYYANYFALKEHGTLVSTHFCVKLDYGPGIDDYREIINDLVEEGIVNKEEPYFVHLKNKNFNQLKNETHNLKSYEKASRYSLIDYSDYLFSEEEIVEVRQFLGSI